MSRPRDIYPLTAMQQGMLVHACAAPDEPVYHQQYVLAITAFDETLVAAGLADLVARTPCCGRLRWDGPSNAGARLVFDTWPCR